MDYSTLKYSGNDFWKNYMEKWFGSELIKKWEKYAEVKQIQSVKGKIEVEVYKNADLTKPTIVFSHGIAGYARLLLPFIIPLFEKGFNIIAPDLEGFGYNKRTKGDFCWEEHLENLNDTVEYAKSVFNGKVFLGGASMGGPLAYATDAKFNCADGLICWCLFDFADKEFIANTSTTKKLTPLLIPLMKLSSKLFGKMQFKTTRFVSYSTLTSDSEFNQLIMHDPQSGKMITLRGALSLVLQSKPDLPHDSYEKPVLVCQPTNDKMTDSYFTSKTFVKIKSKNKKYVEFSGAHFPTDKEAFNTWGEEVAVFLNQVL